MKNIIGNDYDELIKIILQKREDINIDKFKENFENELLKMEEKLSIVYKEMTILYKINKDKDTIKLFGEEFVNTHKTICKIICDGKEYELSEKFNLNNYKKNKEILEIKLKGIINNMRFMFSGCSSLISLPDINKLNITNITDITGMFYGCSSLLSIPDISELNTKNVVYFIEVFRDCKSLNFLPDISR